MNYSDTKKLIESCHLNFLIGSGASRPFFRTLNQVENLLNDLNENTDLEDDKRTIIEASIKYFYCKWCISGNLEIVKGKAGKLNETLNNYEDFLNSLLVILTRRRSNLVSKQVNLFTTNMDVFIDWALEKNQLTFNDGFTGRINPIFGTQNFHNTIRKTSSYYDYQSEIPLFNLFKLHGSVNWKIIRNTLSYDSAFSALSKIEEIEIDENDLTIIEEKKGDKIIQKTLEEIIQQVSDKKLSINQAHLDFLKSFNKLVMINPTRQKFETTTRDLTFYELLRMYSNNLEREGSVLFVFGFSFDDEHIREITKRVAVSNPTLQIIVFAYDYESKLAIEKNLGSRPNISYVYDENEDAPIKYSLDVINKSYFKKLADEFENKQTNTDVVVK